MAHILGLNEALAKRRTVVDATAEIASSRGTGGSTGAGFTDDTSGLENKLRAKFGGYKFSEKSETGFVGLVNQGATCYLNSLLQSMFMTPELRRALYAWKYDPEVHGEARRCVPYQLQRLFARLQLSRQGAVVTREVTRSFGFETADAFQQQDVMECMNVLFEYLATVGAGSPLGDHVTKEQSGSMESYLNYTHEGKEYGHGRSVPFRTVTLYIKSLPDVTTALARHIAPAEISGYFGEEVQQKVTAFKGERFQVLPKILTLHLGRYDFDYSTMRRIKLRDAVNIAETLDMSPYCTMTDQATNYDLYSVMIHTGTAHGGHYFAYIRDLTTMTWYSFNDDNVRVIDEAALKYSLGQRKKKEATPEVAAEGAAATAEAPAEDKKGSGAGAGGAGAGAGASATSKEAEAKAGPRVLKTLCDANKNAYMLVYRRRDPDEKLKPVSSDEVPEDLRKELEKENEEYLQLYKQWQHEKEMRRVRVFLGAKQHIVKLHKDEKLRELLTMCHAAHGLDAPLERVRLRRYNQLKGLVLAPLEDLDVTLEQAEVGNRSNLSLEVRCEGDDFEPWLEGGFQVLLVHLPEGADTFDTPRQATCVEPTVAELRLAARTSLGIAGNVKLVLMTGTATTELDDDSTHLISDLHLDRGATIHVEPWDGEAPSRIVAKFDNVFNSVEVKFNALDATEGAAGLAAKLDPPFTEAISADQRQTLGELKAALAARLGLAQNEFKFMKSYHRGPELKDLDKQLVWYGLAGGSASVYIKRGAPLLPTQTRLKVYLYTPVSKEVVGKLPPKEGEAKGEGDESKAEGAGAAAAAPAPAAAAADPPAPPSAAALAAAAAKGGKGAGSGSGGKKEEEDPTMRLVGQVVVERAATCEDLRRTLSDRFAAVEGFPPASRMRLRAKQGKSRAGAVFIEDQLLDKNAKPLRDGKGIIVQATAVEERFSASSVLLAVRRWHPDQMRLEAGQELAFDKNTTMEAFKEQLSTMSGGEVAAGNIVMARAFAFHTKKAENVPKLKWKRQPANTDTVGESCLMLKSGDVLVYKDLTVAPAWKPEEKKKPTKRHASTAHRETGFHIYTPQEQIERERKRKAELEAKKKKLEEEMAAAKAAREAAGVELPADVGPYAERLNKYRKMIQMGVPVSSIMNKMAMAGLDFNLLNLGGDALPGSSDAGADGKTDDAAKAE